MCIYVRIAHNYNAHFWGERVKNTDNFNTKKCTPGIKSLGYNGLTKSELLWLPALIICNKTIKHF